MTTTQTIAIRGAGILGLTTAYSFEVSPGDSGTIVGILSVVWMVVFIASFAFSLGPVVWTLISEVFPTTLPPLRGN